RGPSSSRYFGTRRPRPKPPRAARSYDDSPYYPQTLPAGDFDMADVLWPGGTPPVAGNRLGSSCNGIHQWQGNGLVGSCRSRGDGESKKRGYKRNEIHDHERHGELRLSEYCSWPLYAESEQ